MFNAIYFSMICLLMFSLNPARAQRAKVRLWTSVTGSTTEASFVHLLDGNVVLAKRQNAEQIAVAFPKLSLEDQRFVLDTIESDLSRLDRVAADAKEKDLRITQLEKQLAAGEDAAQKASETIVLLQREIELYKPSKGMNPQGGVPVVTSKRMKALGRDYLGKTVRMLNCSLSNFASISDSGVGGIPGVTVSTNGVLSRVNIEEKKKWICIPFKDENDDLYQECYGSKAKYAEFFLSLNEEAKFDVEGRVFEKTNSGGDVGIMVSKVVLTHRP